MQQLKLRRMRVRGFKSLADFDLRFHNDLTILIGPNGAGKSSVLQALAFAQYFAKGQPRTFFDDRGWEPSDIRTKAKVRLSPSIVSYRLLLEADDDSKIYWFFNWSTSIERTTFEEIWHLPRLSSTPYPALGFSLREEATIGTEKIPAVGPEGSLMAFFDLDSLDSRTGKVLSSLRQWATGIFSLELLSPIAMRRGARGKPTDIGPRGERLGGFLASLSAAQKDRIVARISQFYPLQNIETTRKRAGWVDLRVGEAFEGQWRTSATHMSDGFMRLLGLASIPEFSDSASTVLLDEVEDGIDPHILPRFINLIDRESKVQLILTSHSPILVNAFDPSQIAFVARQMDGQSIAAPFNDLEPLMEGLQYFGAGEVWTNTDMSRIVELVHAAHSSRPLAPDRDKRATIEQVKAFMGLTE